MSTRSVILDSQTAIALRTAPESLSASDTSNRLFVGRYMKNHGINDLRVTDTTNGEIAGEGHGKRPSVVFSRVADRVDGSLHDEIIRQLVAAHVGRSKGFADREIVAEALMAETDGSTPTFITADSGIYNNLLRMIGIDPAQSPPLWNRFPDGFDVMIAGHRLHVVAVPPSRR